MAEQQVSVTREIDASAETVWAMVSDVTRMGEWSPETDGGAWLGGATGAAPAANDSRFVKGKLYAIGADTAFAISAITLGTAIYYTFRDKGAPSTALIDAKSVTVIPEVNSSYAGLGMEVHW